VPAPNAIIDQVCDGVVSLIQSAWAPTAPNSVAAVDLPFESVAEIDGIQVQVFAGSYLDNGCVTRLPEFEEQYTVTVITFAHFGDAGDPPQSFTRPMRQFVEQMIYNVLKDPTTVQIPITTLNGPSYVWPLRVDEVIAYDAEKLKYLKLFWSSVTVTFMGQLPI
jgi:hypothetical protein